MSTADCISPESQGTLTPVNDEFKSIIDKDKATIIEYVDIEKTLFERYFENQNLKIGTIQFKTEDGLDYGEGKITTKEKSIIEKIEQKIFDKLYFPHNWVEEGIAQPNQPAKMKAAAICKLLFDNCNMTPDRIAPTKEEGIFIAFDNPLETGDRTLFIEVYNNLETAALINDNSARKVIYSEDIQNLDFNDAYKILTT